MYTSFFWGHRLRIFLLYFLLPLYSFCQGTGAALTRYLAQYTPIYSDNVEALDPALSPGFVFGLAGSFTSNPSEVISGSDSIKGAYSGGGSYTQYLATKPTVIALSPNHPYRVTFRYRILAAPDKGFEVAFYSPTGGAAGSFLPSITITGATGATGTATLTNTLGPYADYYVYWDIIGIGAISIDTIQITDGVTGLVIASENANTLSPTVGSGLQLNGATVVTNPSLVIAGKASLRLNGNASFSNNPASLAIPANTTVIIEMQYRILNYGISEEALHLWLQPAGIAWSPATQVDLSGLLKNAPATGTFSSGALTAGAASYTLNVSAVTGSDVVVDNITFYRQDASAVSNAPATWSKLNSLPYPRIGIAMLGTTYWQTQQGGSAEGPPFRVSLNQVERNLAFADVIIEVDADSQSRYPDSIRRLRALNPNAVILPYRIAEEQGLLSAPQTAQVSVDYQIQQQIADAWYLRDIEGNYVSDPTFANIRKMNISPYSPVVKGQTYFSELLNWLTTPIFSSGVWDGVFFDNLFGHINGHILNSSNPALIDVDHKGDGVRETPAWVSDMTRAATTGMLQQFRAANGDLQLVVGNNGPLPELSLAPWVNGYVFEGVNQTWDGTFSQSLYANNESMAGWRQAFDDYLMMQATTRAPHLNVLEGSGIQGAAMPGAGYSTPTEADIQQERFTLGTALLSDGFYSYDLHGSLSVPLWFDEYSVDSAGTAVEDPAKKGYLGQPLADAAELTGPGTLVFHEEFESASLPPSFIPNLPGGAYVTQTPGEVISGSGSLVFNNPDHTKAQNFGLNITPSGLQFAASTTYLLTFDWRILDTFDGSMRIDVYSNGQALDIYWFPIGVKGDSGTIKFPFTVPAVGNWTIRLLMQNGGGSIAIDNFRIYQGGVGPLRRDFENGIALVNPLSQPYTFTAAEIAGGLNRIGLHRIKGTQAPDVNTGQPVSGDLTLGPFDAIVFLADPIHLSNPTVTAVTNAAGRQPGVASGGFVSIYGSNFTPLPYDDWSKSIINGRLPKQLDGISVTMGDKPAYIYAVTSGQINVQAPDVGNGPVQLVVTTGGGSSAPFATNSQIYSPAFFPWPGNQPVATHLDYSIAARTGTFPGSTTVPAKPGEVITLWGTGFGPTNPSVPAGQEPIVAAPTQNPVTVTLGGTPITVLGAVLSSYASVYQVAIQIPASLADGDYAIVATVAGAQSPSSVILSVQH
jgi:uncharacterized protein (TIGR03437 family)